MAQTISRPSDVYYNILCFVCHVLSFVIPCLSVSSLFDVCLSPWSLSSTGKGWFFLTTGSMAASTIQGNNACWMNRLKMWPNIADGLAGLVGVAEHLCMQFLCKGIHDSLCLRRVSFRVESLRQMGRFSYLISHLLEIGPCYYLCLSLI